MSILPEYSPSPCTPSYSVSPHPGEERVEYTPRPSAARIQGNFTRSWKHATVILTNQENTARLPSYGQSSSVRGELHISSPSNTVRVVMKLEGRLNLSIADGTSTSSSIVSEKAVLWSKEAEVSPVAQGACPSVLPFHFQFPSTFANENRAYKLPPSFEAIFLGNPGLVARCSYTLRITLSRGRQYRLGFWTTTKSYHLFLEYCPRSRARLRLGTTDSLFSTVKTRPDEWFQLFAKMIVKPNYSTQPIDCLFLLPSAPTFALADKIPFHVQLRGSLVSLRELLPPTSPLLFPLEEDSRPPGNAAPRIPPIRVFLHRQVVVEVDDRSSFKTFVIGIGKVWPAPPPITNLADPFDNISVNWEGHVQCEEGVTAPGFNTGNLLVKDYIILTLTPPNVRSSPLRILEIVHPVRFVADPWLDSDTLHPQDT